MMLTKLSTTQELVESKKVVLKVLMQNSHLMQSNRSSFCLGSICEQEIVISFCELIDH